MLSAEPKILAKKKRLSKRMIAIRVPSLKFILMNGKQVSPQAMKMSSSNSRSSFLLSSRGKTTDARRKASASRKPLLTQGRKPQTLGEKPLSQ